MDSFEFILFFYIIIFCKILKILPLTLSILTLSIHKNYKPYFWSIFSTESLPNFKMNNPSLDPRARLEPGRQCRLSWLDRRHQNARDVCDQRRLLWPSLLPLFRRVMHPNVPSAKSIMTGSLILPTMFSTFFY